MSFDCCKEIVLPHIHHRIRPCRIKFIEISKLTCPSMKKKGITCARDSTQFYYNFLFGFLSLLLEPRKEKTDSSNGNNNALSPQEQQQQQANLQHMMSHERGGMGGEPMIKPERPNSLGPKLSKRINFYHDNCKLFYC